jgi:predicted RND superfamily exporter protein
VSKNKSGESAMHKVAAFIVDKRNIILLLYVAAFIFSLIAQNWVNVCNDLTAYLPADTETRQGLTIMEDEFVTYATSRVMVANVTYDEAKALSDKIAALPQVEMITFDDTEDHYKAASALFDITMKGETGDAVVAEGYAAVRDLLADYDTYISESDVDISASLANEMSQILAIAAVIIVAVLLLTSQTYMEVPVLLITFVAGIILNKGTNFIFDEISFVSNSVTAVLQLALSIDYAIIMIHHYSEQRETCDQRDAVVNALASSITEISGSSLTTISGLAALMFMQFRIGFDMGICLIKSIFFSLLCVFTLMPCLLMLLGKYIDRTHHKSLLPDISFLGSFVYKLRYVVPPLFAVVLVASFFLSSNCLYTYNANSSKTSRQNETQIAKEMIEEHFGAKNYAALVIPAGDYDCEQALIDELLQCDEVESITSLSSIEAMDGYVLTDKLTPRQFSEMIDLDIDTTKLLYSVYAAENADYSKLITNMNDYSVPIIDMFMFVYDLKSDGYVQLDGELGDSIDDLYAQLNTAKKQLSGENYSRMLVYMNLPVEGDETYAFIDKVHTITAKYYDTSYFVGDSTSCYDLATSFATDNIIVSVLSVLFVILILFFTFKNAGLPVLLILVIQGSVWMNFSMSTITGASIFFLSYLIISSIQMGANIDYAIVISSRYMDLKKEMDIKSAMRSALNFAFPTVLTSGGIMASAGFLISKISTEPAIVSIGTTLCRGTLISMFLVMLVLPEILLLGDSIVEKTGVTIKKPELVRRETGNFVINGHVRGRIEGFVDADVNGAISGNLDAVVKINTFEGEKGDAGDEQKNPDAQA